MSDNIIHVLFSENQEIAPDQVLQAAHGILKSVVLIGYTIDGDFYIAGSKDEVTSGRLIQKGEYYLNKNFIYSPC